MKNLTNLILFCFLFSACNQGTYELKWRVDSNEKIIYKTNLQILQGLNVGYDENNLFAELDEKNKSKIKSSSKANNLKNYYKVLEEQNNSLQHFTFLETGGNDIYLKIVGNRTREVSLPKYPFKNAFPKKKVEFAGKMSMDGSIINVQKQEMQGYFLDIMFELPKKKVDIGDSWALDIPAFDFRNKGDKPGVNKVTLTDVLKDGNDEIGILKYEIKNSGKSSSLFSGTISFTGTGRFNITQGQWKSFEGTLIHSNKGFSEMEQTQNIQMYEIEQEEYIALVNSYNKENTVVEKGQEEKKDIEVKDGKKILVIEEKKTNCPKLFGVQVLATAKPLDENSNELKGLTYKVEQKYDPDETKFKYKYIVGSFCSKSEARKLKREIKKAGFEGAFIVRR